ncbi:MAG: GDP-mannose 4,6-dehydratase, partial [Rhodococcus sp.]|nr:GDP-mannose 4,6-dehydratase [Rhodococcus sp. (in: high G+C Gram-positive bacteria)]
MERVVVTGGAGFIGSCVVRRLTAAGRFVVTVDSLTYAGHVESLGEAMHRDNHRMEVADIRDGEALCRIFDETRP